MDEEALATIPREYLRLETHKVLTDWSWKLTNDLQGNYVYDLKEWRDRDFNYTEKYEDYLAQMRELGWVRQILTTGQTISKSNFILWNHLNNRSRIKTVSSGEIMVEI